MEREKKELSIDEMREKRNVGAAVFKKFTESQNMFDTHAFCFFEGEDGKYYNSRIEEYWGSKFIPLVAGNKKEVIRVMKMIKTNALYNNVCTMFFVDRDYDESLKDTNEDVFETPCYSIENLYAQESAFRKILKAEFGLNIIDPDFNKCINTYKERLCEFNQIILHFNSIVKYKHLYEPEIICQFSSVKTSQLAKISIYEVVKAKDYDKVMNKFTDLLHVTSEQLELIENELKQKKNLSLILRGKNQLDFMVAILKEFKSLNNNGKYFSSKLSRVYIEISKNRLSELSQYAETPPELIDFLKAHSPQNVS